MASTWAGLGLGNPSEEELAKCSGRNMALVGRALTPVRAMHSAEIIDEYMLITVSLEGLGEVRVRLWVQSEMMKREKRREREKWKEKEKKDFMGEYD